MARLLGRERRLWHLSEAGHGDRERYEPPRSRTDKGEMRMMSVSVNLVWVSDPAPGRSALDEKRGTSNKPPFLAPGLPGPRRIAPPITLPRSAGEFSRWRGTEDVEAEPASD